MQDPYTHLGLQHWLAYCTTQRSPSQLLTDIALSSRAKLHCQQQTLGLWHDSIGLWRFDSQAEEGEAAG